MNWADKMDAVVKDVLGIEYKCVINSDTSFSIFENNTKIHNHMDVRYLSSHWRLTLSETLMVIFNQRIQKSLQKV
jgi:hypothetical protein